MYPLLCVLPHRECSELGFTLGWYAVDAAVRAAIGVRCSRDSLNTLLCALPRIFGWRRTRSGDVISTQEDAHEFALKLFHSCSSLDDAMCVHVSARVVCDTCRQST